MKKIKNNGACVPNMVLGFLGSSDTQAPYSFSFLFSSFFFFFFPRSFSASILSFSSFFLLLFLLSPSILVLFAQTQTHMPQAPLSNQWVSLFGFFFFFFGVGFCAYGVADLLWWGGGRGFVGIGVVEVWVCGSAWWRVWVCGNRRLWWVLVMAQIRVWFGQWWVAWLFDG